MKVAILRRDNYEGTESFTGHVFTYSDTMDPEALKSKVASRLKIMNDERNAEQKSRQYGFKYKAKIFKGELPEEVKRKQLRREIEDERDETLKKWLKAVMQSYENIPLEDLEALVRGSPPEFEMKSDEYISMRNRASVQTTEAHGTKTCDSGNTYEASVTVSSNVNGL